MLDLGGILVSLLHGGALLGDCEPLRQGFGWKAEVRRPEVQLNVAVRNLRAFVVGALEGGEDVKR